METLVGPWKQNEDYEIVYYLYQWFVYTVVVLDSFVGRTQKPASKFIRILMTVVHTLRLGKHLFICIVSFILEL